MKIALIGYGKMGQMIDTLAPSFDLEVVSIIDPHHSKASHQNITRKSVESADVCVEFSSPNCALKNIQTLSAFKKNIVVGTTGWQSPRNELEKLASLNQIGVFHAPNFSIGVYLFSKIVEFAAELIEPFNEFEISCDETHHKHKKDSPSGTALHLASSILKKVSRKKTISFDSNTLQDNELYISSKRRGEVIGDHSVDIDALYDKISLSHHCKDRKSFAIGALKAALWLQGKTGVFNFDHMIKELAQRRT
ncbi:MAG: 4-hydroxy-tetrahydrodipicolinate reductase [Chlamydiae bacterium]|nr:4-hydroxy-tetrahydrodipicolinate reductase [Chlamydiota bacterium]